MAYRFNAILDFNPEGYRKCLKYFQDARKNNLNLLQLVEEKEKLVQETFDIYHPNISFYIGQFPFDKKKDAITLSGYFSVNANNNIVNAKYSTASIGVDPRALVPSANPELGKDYLDQYFLKKDANNFTVYWTYDATSSNIYIDKENIDDAHILPSLKVAELFYRRVRETFTDLRVKSHDLSDPLSMIYKGMLETEFNNRQNPIVYCNPLKIVGDSFVYNQGKILIDETPISIDTESVSFSDAYIYSANSPISNTYAVNNFAEKDLKNLVSLVVEDRTMDEREDEEIISLSNFNSSLATILSSDTTVLDSSYGVLQTGGNKVENFSGAYAKITARLSLFYASQLKLFLTGYSGNGAIGELLKYIEEKIKNLNDSYVTIDGCSKKSINNIDEGCKMECDNISFTDKHLMVTKQKMKSALICSLSCDRSL